MNSLSESTVAALTGLAFCGIVFLLTGALLVIATVPRARRTVLDGLALMLGAAVALADTLARLAGKPAPADHDDKKPPA